jgi:hypothetical protein
MFRMISRRHSSRVARFGYSRGFSVTMLLRDGVGSPDRIGHHAAKRCHRRPKVLDHRPPDPGVDRSLSPAPIRHRCLQRPGAALGKPYGSPAPVGFRRHHLRPSRLDQEVDIARQGRLIEPRTVRQRPHRIIRRGRDEAHEAELRRTYTRRREAVVEELRKLARRAAQMPARIPIEGVGSVVPEAWRMLHRP